jgi:hypothetical protein
VGATDVVSVVFGIDVEVEMVVVSMRTNKNKN